MVNPIEWFINLFPDKEDERKDGLRNLFSVGERIPMKGIWFKIESVEFDEIVLRPKTATAKRVKAIHKLRLVNA